jgi:Transposase DDE domain
MSRHPGMYQWNMTIAKHFSHLSKPMVGCLALWTIGMIVARSCSLTAVAWVLQPVLGAKFYTVRERLRDLYREALAKRGRRRCELDLGTCWAPWLAWVVEGWPSKQLALALDTTALGEQFTVLVLSVLYRGCAVPVAWKVLKANQKHSWRPEWITLLSHFRQRVAADWTVIVLTDRGLYAKWLFQAITALGWHPLMRIKNQGRIRHCGGYHWGRLADMIQQVGQRWQGRATLFKDPAAQLECTLLAYWGEGHAEPWLVVTDLPPEAADVCWYGMRAWIEQGFKRIKRGGWQWQYTRMHDPARAERLWLAVAIATWWLMSVGGETDETIPAETLADVPYTQRRRRPRWRLVAVFRQGWNQIIAALLQGTQLPLRTGRPEPWPQHALPTAKYPENIPKNLQL